ncbi:hypothetical protein TREMEDRAFT_41962 [Tremella mesenterica DSM 1558]|uniref:uncharacterized protein n=1 Tax=Tremella mesenterica (strain ATCC 24925 / CBS 8224 / DSM 1558 / NBRC 9311 / NRRL Y-6157 / RJB 2259-6 / UBC 559-6) TaxID=578456 RepID=UPI0003F4A194|nr:uncharacterized protein TREMEDRAFT_41962 [Tremella mesenterica DSM 1558]EIW72763.1 hypothetical protein TREMEDRAFT_41962 [Tremella mesenterica DSM 1558]
MSSFHPTRREVLLVIILTLLMGLFMQFDLSLRFTDASGSDSLLGFKVGFGRGGRSEEWDEDDRPTKTGDKWLEHVELGAKHGGSNQMTGMTDAKVRWAEQEGAPRTEVLAHAPGWTIFDQLYLYNGTWFIVTDNPSSIPLLRLMTSTGKEVWNDEESILGREPTEKDMRIIFPSEAKKLWGQSASRVAGTTMLINDPSQFLDHYYHFAAELLLGLWKTYASLDTTITPNGVTHLPSPSRMIFPHVAAGKWNDYAKMNSFISRAIFPSMSYEYETDFLDRADTGRAFAFERVVFADRAASFRGANFQKTWRTASEAVTLQTSKYWWTPIRKNLLEFVGGGRLYFEEVMGVGVEVGDGRSSDEIDLIALEEEEGSAEEEKEEMLEEISRSKQAKSGKPVITYVSRQEWGRRMLKKQSHESLVRELQELEKKYGWEVNIVSMDQLSRDEQIRLAARTTVMLGVHGNGLTHLLWMNAQNPRSTVIEFFYPGGFAEDYEFTARALGIKHYGVWDDQVFTEPDTPQLAYPEGFQGNEIPLNGKVVSELITQRLLVERLPVVNSEDGDKRSESDESIGYS